MHHRGEVATPEGIKIRGSIWIEQELAIAAFLQNIVGKQIQVRLYVERGIIREGLRDKLILNPVVFDADKEVIEDLAQVLPSWDASARPSLSLDISHQNRAGSARDYKLVIKVENRGSKTIRNYCVDALFPTPFTTSASHARHIQGDGWPGFQRYRVTSDNSPVGPIYPGPPVSLLSFDYYINPDNPAHQNALHEEVVIRLIADDQIVDEVKKQISELM